MQFFKTMNVLNISKVSVAEYIEKIKCCFEDILALKHDRKGDYIKICHRELQST